MSLSVNLGAADTMGSGVKPGIFMGLKGRPQHPALCYAKGPLCYAKGECQGYGHAIPSLQPPPNLLPALLYCLILIIKY